MVELEQADFANSNVYKIDQKNLRLNIKQVAKDLPNILSNNPKEVPINELLSKICVSPPYFAFKKIYQYQDFLISSIEPEQPKGSEIGKLNITEAGRHLAILGSCLLALDEREKFYYLAFEAKMKAIETDNQFENDQDKSLFLAVMKSSDGNGVYGIIFDKNSIIYDLEVKYQKLSEKIFKRLFKDFALEYSPQINSPYKTFPVHFEALKIVDNSLECTIPEIGYLNCSGHFDHYPMLPVAISSYLMSKAAGNLYCQINNKEKYKIIDLELSVLKPSSPMFKKIIVINWDKKEDTFLCFLKDKSENLESKMKLKITC